MSFLQHKFLDCIRAFIDGIVEMEETFVTESFKYNHKKSGFKMLRPLLNLDSLNSSLRVTLDIPISPINILKGPTYVSPNYIYLNSLKNFFLTKSDSTLLSLIDNIPISF